MVNPFGVDIMLSTKVFSERITYTGSELASHWISQKTGTFQSSIVAFRGPCRVETSELVDMEDRNQKCVIASQEMLHFLGEWFEGDLSLAIARQRLFIAGFADLLRDQLSQQKIQRVGNDLYIEDIKGNERRKLSVSIVTATPVSTLFHFGVNIDATGAPVKAIGLSELGIDPDSLAVSALDLWKSEWASMSKARCKVASR